MNLDRRHPFRVLDRSTVGRMLWPLFADRPVALLEPVASGRCNSNYRVSLAGLDHALFLRVHARGLELAQKELALARRLRGTVPVAEPLHDQPLELVVETAGNRDVLVYSVYTWIPCPTLERALETAAPGHLRALGTAAGESLGAIASILFDASGDLDPDLRVRPWPGTGEEAVDAFVESCLSDPVVRARLGSERERRVRALVLREGRRLAGEMEAASLVHSDFGPGNLLVEQRGLCPRVAAVVDWEFAHAGSPLVDIGNMLREHRGLPNEFTAAFLDAFTSVRGPLPCDWLARARLLDLTAQLDFLRVARDRGEIERRALETIDRTLERWSSYLDPRGPS